MRTAHTTPPFHRSHIPTQYKWLDLCRLCQVALPRSAVGAVRYCPARMSVTATDRGRPARQEAYLQALRTRAGLPIHYAEFVVNERYLKLVEPAIGGIKRARVWIREEKGDWHLKEPIRLIRQELGKVVGGLHVDGDRRCVFAGEVEFIRPLRESHVRSSQIPDPVIDSGGKVIHRPAEWASRKLTSFPQRAPRRTD